MVEQKIIEKDGFKFDLGPTFFHQDRGNRGGSEVPVMPTQT